MKNNPQKLLLWMTFIMSLVFAVWQVLLNNFVIERAQFTGAEIGILQSLREVPGFLAFTAIFVLLLIKEQAFALLSLALLCIGVAVTGFFPQVLGLYITTVLMSIGFHYFETINQSLTLQWVEKKNTAEFLGKALAWRSAAALIGYGSIWLVMSWLKLDYQWMYAIIGTLGLIMVITIRLYFPTFKQGEVQHKKIILRKRYWLYYMLTFFSGARRQIFMVFAGFMMVEKFGYSISQITSLFLINYVVNLFFAPAIGRFIARIGERNALTIEYLGLIAVFTSYAVVEHAEAAAALYVIDHLLFAMAIAVKTYFQKIADPKDIAATMSVSFTINHIAAVIIPVLLGLLWLTSPSLVFYIGAGFAVCSLILAMNVPRHPKQGEEVALFGKMPPLVKADK
ncbi:MFS transporter [Shewanella sp. Choline-02u-19]|uniref:MFS transporter n=1 Tax=unclassified Shewanella TaxID=196818 RepID=UPI000C32DE4F|nr:MULTISPECIES: MFS transporter [unclassified Shewanella]PKG57837.1 MFS transporter [Shewanella sp. GutDb-MelDb]PKG76025.1 MFS transporter [Shewanella sp. GutCb]PKH56694.1 MFS transporter [Shewanella sp. Bg11-22]PKI30245.1 MFS transporter [Shewanella sp. Choline-02u-19]